MTAVAVVVVLGVRNPLIIYATLFASFPLIDLLRKLGSDSPGLVFGKDVLIILATVALLGARPGLRRLRDAMRSWSGALLLFALWFTFAAVNAALFQGIALAALGFREYFEFLPLLVLGWYLSQDYSRLTRSTRFACVLLCAVSLVGVYQAIAGPQFLAQRVASKYFTHLALLRASAGQTANAVFQPTGVFVETGRYQNWTFITFVVGLALLPHRAAGRWRFIVLAIGAIGMFAASGRTSLVAGVITVVAVVARRLTVDWDRAVRTAVVGCLLFATLALGVRVAYPQLFESRVQFVGRSLNVTSRNAEFSSRVPTYASNVVSAIRYGGIVGRGAGTQSLGRQYIGSAQGLTVTEGGFATVAVETGAVGLVLWLLWTFRCCAATIRRTSQMEGAVGESMRTLAIALAPQMFVIFFVNVAAFQDFTMNAWFFLVVGLVAGVATHDPRAAASERAQDPSELQLIGR